MKKQSGFTLIELLLVLAIIGIISAIAIPALLGQRERAKAKSTQANIAAISKEVVRVNDTLKDQGTMISASALVTSVLALSNYTLPPRTPTTEARWPSQPLEPPLARSSYRAERPSTWVGCLTSL